MQQPVAMQDHPLVGNAIADLEYPMSGSDSVPAPAPAEDTARSYRISRVLSDEFVRVCAQHSSADWKSSGLPLSDHEKRVIGDVWRVLGLPTIYSFQSPSNQGSRVNTGTGAASSDILMTELIVRISDEARAKDASPEKLIELAIAEVRSYGPAPNIVMDADGRVLVPGKGPHDRVPRLRDPVPLSGRVGMHNMCNGAIGVHRDTSQLSTLSCEKCRRVWSFPVGTRTYAALQEAFATAVAIERGKRR